MIGEVEALKEERRRPKGRPRKTWRNTGSWGTFNHQKVAGVVSADSEEASTCRTRLNWENADVKREVSEY